MVVVACLCQGGVAAGCRIPVFRYALERWAPDPYVVEVVRRGPLDAAGRALVERLEAAASDPVNPANLTVVRKAGEQKPVRESGGGSAKSAVADPAKSTSVDPTKSSAAGAAEKSAAVGAVAAAPAELVLYAARRTSRTRVWSGPLDAQNVDRLIDSPARRQLVDHLLDGDSAVWILIAAGDETKDRRAEKVLREELKRMAQVLELPSREDLEAEVEFRDDTPVELRIGFSLIVLKRDNPAEAIFVAQLLASEPDLKDFDEPIALPIFGRGRTYYALVGAGIDRDNIEANCRFVCGDCSCQVKQQNPGVDLLLAADWESNVQGTAMPYRELPVLTGIGGLELAQQVAHATTSEARSNGTDAAAASTGAPLAHAPRLSTASKVAAGAAAARASAATQPGAPGVPAAAGTSAGRALLAGAAGSPAGQTHTPQGPPKVAPAGNAARQGRTAEGVANEGLADEVSHETALSFEHRLLLWSVLAAVFAGVSVAIGSLWLNTH